MGRHYLIILMFLAGPTLLMACAGRTPASAVTNFYRAIESGDADTATSLLSDETIGMIGEEKLRAGFQKTGIEIKEKGGIAEIQITKEDIVGDAAKVTAMIKYGNGTAETEVYDLVKQNGQWKLRPSK